MNTEKSGDELREMTTMKTKPLMWTMLAAITILAGACGTPRNSDQPWDRPTPEYNDRGYNTPDPFPMDRGSKGTNGI